MESSKIYYHFLLFLGVSVVFCSLSFLSTASAAAPTRVVPRGGPVQSPARGEKPEKSRSVPVKEAKSREQEGMVVPTYPGMQDEAPKSYMSTVSAVPQKEKEVSSQSPVIMLPEKQRRKVMPYSQMPVPKETIVYKDDETKMYPVTPEDMYHYEVKPVMVEEEMVYSKTYQKMPAPKTRTPMKMQRQTDKMETMKDVEAPTKPYGMMQGMEMEEPTNVMVESMFPVMDKPFMMKQIQYVKAPQMRGDIQSNEAYMKMKVEEKVHEHADCGGVPCVMTQQVCEVPPCKTPSICRDCDAMKVTSAVAPSDTQVQNDMTEKTWPGFMQRYTENKESMVVPAYMKTKDQAPRYHTVPCAYGMECIAQQYEGEGIYHKPTAGCRTYVHPMSSTPVVDCTPMTVASYSPSPARDAMYAREKMGMPPSSAPAPNWGMPPSMSVPVHEAERVPVPMHRPSEGAPAEEWQMPAVPPVPAPAVERVMPWTKSQYSGPNEKVPETFVPRRSSHYYYPTAGSTQRIMENVVSHRQF